MPRLSNSMPAYRKHRASARPLRRKARRHAARKVPLHQGNRPGSNRKAKPKIRDSDRTPE